jgi:Arc/MetJ family transcription regulator
MKARCPIATNLDLDNKAIEDLVRVGKFKSKKEAVNTAVRELLRRRSQAGIVELFGKVDYDPDYDYKKLRTRKRR